MNPLIQKFPDLVKGTISGFDRIVFKGLIRPLAHVNGVIGFCHRRGILNKQYRDWMMEQSAALIEAVESYSTRECGHPVTHIPSLHTSKEDLARTRQMAEGIDTGLLGVWSCVESGSSYRAAFCADSGFPQLRRRWAPCKHLYFYFDDSRLGFMNVRLQTWFPYHIQVCMNGREWLRRSLMQKKVGFRRHRNKLLHIDDCTLAQEVLDAQLDARWPKLLDGFLPTVFPTMQSTLGPDLSYYWTMWQSEWATDLLFRSSADLQDLMNPLLRHALMTGTSERVMRYLGRTLKADGSPPRNFRGQVTTRIASFDDGVRVRHWIDRNSVKVYNEHNVLRIETTINAPEAFSVYRRAGNEPLDAPKKLRPLRKGVADVVLRAQLSEQVNKRFGQHIATLSSDTAVGQLFAEVLRDRNREGRKARALVPLGKDRELLQAIADPCFTVSGMTNAKLCDVLRTHSWAGNRTDKQLSARLSRHLRLLRDHGLIRKIPNRRRYLLTNKGHEITTALNAMLSSSTQKLMEIAA